MNEVRELLIIAKVVLGVEPFDLNSKYRHWNSRAFGGELPSLPLKWIRSKRVGGMVRASIRYDNPFDRRMGKGNITLKDLSISNFLKMDEARFDGIMLHEMVHVYNLGVLGINERRGGHGSQFLEKRREVASKTGVDIPLTEDISNLELAEDIPEKQVGVVLAKKGSKTLMQVFSMRSLIQQSQQIADRLRSRNYLYPWFAILGSKERELMKYPEQRKEGRSWWVIADSFADELLRGGVVITQAAA